MEGSGVGSGGCVYSAFGCVWRVGYVVGCCNVVAILSVALATQASGLSFSTITCYWTQAELLKYM